jgi:Flp pilus assembly protein CpaB
VTYRARNIGLAAALGLVALLLIMLYVKKSDSGSTSIGESLVGVFVASHDISAGTPGAEMNGAIHVQEVPRNTVVAGAISSKDQVQGLVSTAPILAGQQVTKRQFQRAINQGITGMIAKTQRAFQLPGDSNQLLVNTLKAGDRVDVIASVKFTNADFKGAGDSTQNQRVASRVVLRNLLVLQDPEPPAGAGKFGNSESYAVLLRVTDNQAQKLFYVTKNADWTLAVRPSHASANSPGSSETAGSILGDGLNQSQYSSLVFGSQVSQP